MSQGRTGRIDVHSHLLPGIDDGCRSLAESVRCARRMVGAGYTHSFVTPHVWPSLRGNTAEPITRLTALLRAALAEAGVPLTLYPGGEINLHAGYRHTPAKEVVTYGLAGRFALFDLWADRLPDHFWPSVAWFKSLGIQPILAHPERMAAVQNEPALADEFARMGLWLQGNLQCLTDDPGTPTRRTIERFIDEGRYFMLGSDLHREETLQKRLDGLARAEELVGPAGLERLTVANPATLLPEGEAG